MKINTISPLIALVLLVGKVQGQDPVVFFKSNCASCHTVGGGRLTGPDLKNIAERRDAAWLEEFILDPPAMINSGDPTATQLLRDFRGVIMPKVNGVNPGLIQALINLITAESALEKSQFIGLQLSDRPLTAADVAMGDSLFSGLRPFESGGHACMGCHRTQGIGLLGGGLLGPDLTQVYGRLGGRKALASWLSSPISPTMQPIFNTTPLDGEEILALVAYFESSATQLAVITSTQDFHYLVAGLLGTIFLLVLFDIIWGRRLRSVRRALVKGKA